MGKGLRLQPAQQTPPSLINSVMVWEKIFTTPPRHGDFSHKIDYVTIFRRL